MPAYSKLRARMGPRQKQVLFWVAIGKSNSAIGQILGISGLTVKNHVACILRYYKVSTRVGAVMTALLQGDLMFEQVRDYYQKANGGPPPYRT